MTKNNSFINELISFIDDEIKQMPTMWARLEKFIPMLTKIEQLEPTSYNEFHDLLELECGTVETYRVIARIIEDFFEQIENGREKEEQRQNETFLIY